MVSKKLSSYFPLAFLFSVLILLVGSGSADAAMLSVTNAGFEADMAASGSAQITNSFTGWDQVGAPTSSGYARPDFPNSTPALIHTIDSTPEGSQFGFARNGVGLTQILAATFSPNLTYQLTVQAALSSLSEELTENPSSPGTYRYDMGYQISLGVSGVGVLVSADFTESTENHRDDIFRQATVTWEPGDDLPGTSAEGEPLVITLRSINAGSTGGASFAAAFDDVRLESFSSAVPEPDAIILTVIASICSFLIRRRFQVH